ncbi:hypothetical protein GJAV_G00156720 [Gymnothorax javanicus]|nr:hypothetical protein GJAV_G00156720 [Gymnothorax javanicus]
MKFDICLAALAVTLICVNAEYSPPKVQVYSKTPGYLGMPNRLICHVSGFHPPDISIQLLKNGKVIQGANQTDLAFDTTWQFHLTRCADFTPKKDVQFCCRVKHGTEPAKDYNWEADM